MDHGAGDPIDRFDLARLSDRFRQTCRDESPRRLLGHRGEEIEILEGVLAATTLRPEHDEADDAVAPAQGRRNPGWQRRAGERAGDLGREEPRAVLAGDPGRHRRAAGEGRNERRRPDVTP